jgi:hypothetical protein
MTYATRVGVTVPRGPRQSPSEAAWPHELTSRNLTTSEAQAVVDRKTQGRVHYPLANGVVATRRVRYARQGSALYIPVWTNVDAWHDEAGPQLECDVSEVDGYACWRYVWLRGHAAPLYPTGCDQERHAWREGIAVLRRAVITLAPMDDLALANFGVVRFHVESWLGALVPWVCGDVLPDSAM